MVEHTESMLESWRDGEVRDPHEDMRQLTLAIVAKTLFGTELAGEADIVGESVEIVSNLRYTEWVVREFAMMEAVLLLATIARRYQLQIESRRIPVPANELSPTATVCIVRFDHLARFVDQAR
jgi:cytochrome P450